MSCSVLTADRVQRLLDGALDATAKETLAKHFERPCEACLDRLAGLDAGRIVVAVAGRGAVLSLAERDQLFLRALGEVPTVQAPTLPKWLGERFPPRLRLLLVLGSVLLLGLLPILFNRPGRAPGPEAGGLGFTALEVGTDSPSPRRLGERAEVSSRDQLVFHVQLDRPALVYLWVVTKTGATLAFAPEASAEALPAGEHELESGGHAVALEPARLAEEGRMSVVAVASPARLASPERLDPRASDFGPKCPGCAAAHVELELR